MGVEFVEGSGAAEGALAFGLRRNGVFGAKKRILAIPGTGARRQGSRRKAGKGYGLTGVAADAILNIRATAGFVR